MQVIRFGDGLGVFLPTSTISAWDLREGDEVEVHVIGRNADPKRQAEVAEALKRLRKYRGLLPADFRFDREEANARR